MTTYDRSVDASTTFSTDPSGLEESVATEVVDVSDGDTFELRIVPVAKQLGPNRVRMLSYNRSIPGPTLRVPQGAEIIVPVRNDGDIEATVHWHGLRLDNKYDGVPYETQNPIPIDGTFTYRLKFPDAGLYWYHPHIREDYGLDLGLSGNIIVVPANDDYWAPVNRELVLTVDDLLIEDGKIAPFHRAGPTHVAMGRFGNVMLTGGEPHLGLTARAGEVVRFYLTNTANTRVFDVRIPGVRVKLIGGDSGRYEHETFVEGVLLAPSERAIVDVLFQTPGSHPIQHRTPDHTYLLGTIVVSDEPVERSFAGAFETLRTSAELTAERARVESARHRRPDKTLVFESEIPLIHDGPNQGTAAPTGPMHPDTDRLRTEPGPTAGTRLAPAVEDAGSPPGQSHDTDPNGGIEWEDMMPEVSKRSDPTTMIWKLVDGATGKTNRDIDWAFRVGEQVKIRLINATEQDHPMYHPFHIHGAGRFLVLARNGNADPNLVWKDTILVRPGETVDILLDITSPGRWMAHCHIAEHNQGGMMFSFQVTENLTPRPAAFDL